MLEPNHHRRRTYSRFWPVECDQTQFRALLVALMEGSWEPRKWVDWIIGLPLGCNWHARQITSRQGLKGMRKSSIFPEPTLSLSLPTAKSGQRSHALVRPWKCASFRAQAKKGQEDFLTSRQDRLLIPPPPLTAEFETSISPLPSLFSGRQAR
jgi:hypothetical protein